MEVSLLMRIGVHINMFDILLLFKRHFFYYKYLTVAMVPAVDSIICLADRELISQCIAGYYQRLS